MFDVECSMFLSKSARGLAHSKTLRVQCELSKQPTGLGLHRLKQGEHSAARCASIWPSERPARRGLRALPTNFPRNPNPRCKTRIIFPRQRRAKSLESAVKPCAPTQTIPPVPVKRGGTSSRRPDRKSVV